MSLLTRKQELDIQELKRQLYLKDRIKNITKRSAKGITEDTDAVKAEMEKFFDFWQANIEKAKNNDIDDVVYGNVVEKQSGTDKIILFKTYDYKNRQDNAYTVMTSMRNVDQAVKGMIITNWNDDDE